VTSCAAWGIWSSAQVFNPTGTVVTGRNAVEIGFVVSSWFVRVNWIDDGVCDGMTIWRFLGNVNVFEFVETVVDGIWELFVVNLTNLTELFASEVVCGVDDVVDGETRMIFVLPIWIFVVGFGTTVWKLRIRGVTKTAEFVFVVVGVDWRINCGWWICCWGLSGDVCEGEFRRSIVKSVFICDL